jgi:hypothetical protein
VNPDILGYQIQIQRLYFTGVLDYIKSRQEPSILEIGGGYGGFAHSLNAVIRPKRYVLSDLTESLLFSSVYLGITGGDEFSFVPNFLLRDEVGKGTFNLIVNTSSLCEMTPHQIREYADLINKLLADDGVFFEANYEQPTTPVINESLSRYFKHIVIAGRNKLWYRHDSVLKAVHACKPQDTRNRASLTKKIVSEIGVKKALRMLKGKEWVKLMLHRY